MIAPDHATKLLETILRERGASIHGIWTRWQLIAGRQFWLWRAVDDEGEVLDLLVQRRHDKTAAVKLMRKLLKKHRFAPDVLVTDQLRSYAAAKSELSLTARHEQGLRRNNRAENSHQPFRRRERAMQRFRSRRRCRSSAQFMPRCTTNSIRSAISSRGKSTSRDALQPWLSGALSWHRSPLARWRSRCMSTSLRYFDTASTADRPNANATNQASTQLSVVAEF